MNSLMRGFFSKKRKLADNEEERNREGTSREQKDRPFDCSSYCVSPASLLEPDSIRMLVLDNQHRVLFDSLTVIPVTDPLLPNAKRSACGLFQLLRRSSDVRPMEQLVFGATPCNAANDSFKLHTLSDSDKLLISRIFTMNRSGRVAARSDGNGSSRHISESHASHASSDSDSQYTNTVRSADGLGPRSIASMAMPENFIPIRSGTSSRGEEEEPCSSSFSPPHRLSIDTRLHLSQSTSLSESTPSIWRSRSRLNSLESVNIEDDSQRLIAFALLIPAAQRSFILQHIPILENEFSRLEARMKRACLHPATFIENVHGAFKDVAQSICQLHNATRIKNPLWLCLHDYSAAHFTPPCPEKDAIARDFCDRLAETIKRLETKHDNFFLSRLISAILMHHMSWIASVASTPVNDHTPFEWEERGSGVILGGSRISYNAHLAQYLEINGNIGSAQRTAKTVICGSDPILVMKLIYIMSYFIRCCTIQEKTISEDSLVPLSIEECLPSSYPHEYPSLIPPASTSASSFSSSNNDVGCSSLPKDYETPPSSCASPISMQSVHSASISTTATLTSSDVLGRSLLAGISNFYYHHLVLSGFDTTVVDPERIRMRIYEELLGEETQAFRVPSSLLLANPSTSSLCEPAQPEALIVFANVSSGVIEVCSTEGQENVSSPCECVATMLEQFSELYGIGTAPRFLLSLIEDSLTEILTKSRSLVELVSESRSPSPSSFVSDRVRSIVDVDHSDLRLLVNVASVYCPSVLSSVS